MAKNRLQLLPEILLQIMECVVPPDADTILRQSHISTKTLIALSTASSVTYTHAQKLLRQHCLYLDSRDRVESFLRCLQAEAWGVMLPKELRVAAAHCAPSMYLAPFDRGQLDDAATARLVRALLYAVSGSLRRLVVRMPFAPRHLTIAHVAVRRILRGGFAQLQRLEEFVGLDEYPNLNQTGSLAPLLRTEDVWHAWPALRRLAVFGAAMDNEALWNGLARRPQLQEVVLARPRSVGLLDIKTSYYAAGAEAVEGGFEFDRMKRLRVMLMDVSYDVQDIRTDGWAESDPEGRMTVEVYAVPTSYYGDETEQQTVVQWVERGVWSGKLWDWRGEVVRELSEIGTE